ncbi:MAG TPA: heme o synthase [Vicinamibacterales bacterium]|jgi:protoheme IX farnesyltransferase
MSRSLSVELTADAGATSRLRFADFITITKARLNFLVIITAAAGYYLGAGDHFDFVTFVHLVVGTGLVAFGSAVFNQTYERDTDALMRRTRMRPLPDGRIQPGEALLLASVLSGAGTLELALWTNWLATGLAVLTLVTYAAIYTPMKRRTSLATLVGAIPGALPPIVGWAAGQGSLPIEAWALFSILFLWQMPHFLALGWMYREDFARAGFPLLPVIEPDGRSTGRQTVMYAAALVPVSLIPCVTGLAGGLYFVAGLILGAGLVALAVRFAMTRTVASARRLFLGSIAYLPLLLGMMILGHLLR